MPKVNAAKTLLVPLFAVLAVFAGGSAIAGCDQTDEEDYDTHTETVEKQLVSIVEDRIPGEVESVSCPDDLDLSVGERYECDVTMTDGRKLVAVVESTSKGESEFVSLKKASG